MNNYRLKKAIFWALARKIARLVRQLTELSHKSNNIPARRGLMAIYETKYKTENGKTRKVKDAKASKCGAGGPEPSAEGKTKKDGNTGKGE